MTKRKSKEEKDRQPGRVDRCAWETKGTRCQMGGTINPSPSGTGRWFCLWHYSMGISSPELVKFSDDLEAFVAWIEGHRKFYGFPLHAIEKGCPWCSHTLSSLWAALTKGVTDPLDVEGVVTDMRAERDGGGGYEKAVAEDYSALIKRILNRTVANWRMDLNALNARHGMTEYDVDPEPPEPPRRRAYTGGHHKSRDEMIAEAERQGVL